MTDQQLNINLSTDSSSGTVTPFVNLTQDEENGTDKTASIYDISQMVARARSGMSAHTYKKDHCPADVTSTGITVRLPFFAWPSSADLGYSVKTSYGELSDKRIVDEYVEFSAIFDHTNSVDLGFMLTEISGHSWETPCFNDAGSTLFNVGVDTNGLTRLTTQDEVTGVLRVRGRRQGATYTVTAKLVAEQEENSDPLNPELIEGISFDNLQISVTATWLDGEEERTDVLRLLIPQCIKDLIDTCKDEETSGGGSSGTNVCDLDDRPEQLTVYVSACTGKVLEERVTKEDPDSWCKDE